VRVLVTGAAGLLGGRLAALLLADGFSVVGARHTAPPPEGVPDTPLDLLEPGSVERALDATDAEAVLHSAVLQSEGCEARPRDAEALNHRAPESLARACRARGLRLVALSTDMVFAGDRPFLREEDAPGPLQTYGRTKLAGEQALLAAHPGAAVVRLALIVGRGHGPRATASESIAWALRGGASRSLRLFTDEYRTPVDPESVAQGVASLLRGTASGVFHLAGSERISRFELGRRVAALLGLSPDAIEAARQADHPGRRRPPDLSLDISRARSLLGFSPRPLDVALREGRAGPGEVK
jgi:dTDP-4-dehydrorhamnose reductase